MPEPYKTYVRQRSETITAILQDVVGDVDVQLCPRAITPDERVFPPDNSYVYGTIVKTPTDGHKSVLYSPAFRNSGVATTNPQEALRYAQEQIKKGNRIRLKDPRESDGQGQHSVESIDELLPVFHEIVETSGSGCVLMPHLDKISHRISVGQLSLGALGKFCYLGREETVLHDGVEVYGGTALGLFHGDARESEAQVEQHFDIPEHLVKMGKTALDAYSKIALYTGRVSVDVIEGLTDGGEVFRGVIDVTPRIGGTTPAEVLALREIHNREEALCFASSKLIYDPPLSPTSGVNFIDTDKLIINAQIYEVRG